MFSSSLHKSSERKNDIYLTPEKLVKDVINLIEFTNGDIVLDPSAGDNQIFYNNFPSNVTRLKCEITDGTDFFEFNQPVDWIIGNPPWSKLTKWFKHTCEITNKGFCYVAAVYSLSYNRIKMITEAGFKLVYYQPFIVKSWFGYPVCVFVFSKIGDGIHKLDYSY